MHCIHFVWAACLISTFSRDWAFRGVSTPASIPQCVWIGIVWEQDILKEKQAPCMYVRCKRCSIKSTDYHKEMVQAGCIAQA